MTRRLLKLFWLAGLTCLAVLPELSAQTWNGAGPNNNWSTATNWVGNVAPANNGSAKINLDGSTRRTPVVDAAWDVLSVTFSNTAAGFTLSGSNLTIRAGGITNNSAVAQRINNDITVRNAQNWNAASGNFTAGGGVVLNGVALTVVGGFDVSILGVVSSNGRIIHSGSGVLLLDNANTYTGGTTLNAGGTLSVGDTIAMGSGSLTINGGTFQSTKGLTGSTAISNTVTVAGNFTIAGGQNLEFNNTIALGSSTRTITVSNTGKTTTFSGNVSGTSGLIKDGADVLIFLGTNTYSGATTINAGELRIQYRQSVSAGANNSVTVASGAYLGLTTDFDPTTLITASSAGSLAIDFNSFTQNLDQNNIGNGLMYIGSVANGKISGGSLVPRTADNTYRLGGGGGNLQIAVNNYLTGTSALLVNGDVQFNNPQNYTGTTTVNAGILKANGDNVFSSSSVITLAGGATLDNNNKINVIPGLSGSGTVLLGSKSLTVSNNADYTFSGEIREAGGLIKSGTGTLTLSGANTFTGSLSNQTGRVRLGAADRLADSMSLVLIGGAFDTAGFNESVGTLDLQANSVLDLGSGSSVLRFTNSAAITWGSATLTVTNWSGVETGGGTDQLYVGTSSSGLTAGQLSKIQFVIGPQTYSARILSSGEVVPVTIWADVAANKTGPTNVLAGANYDYTITVTNTGPNISTNVVASDTLPSTVTFVSANGGGSYGGGVVTWPGVILAVGATTNFTVTVFAPGSGTLTNTVSSTADTYDTNTSNNDGSAAAAQVITTVTPQGAPGSDNSSCQTATNIATKTWSHTVSSGTNRFLIVGFSMGDKTKSVTNVTYGGVSLSFIGRSAVQRAVELWGLTNPAVGTANIVANWNGNEDLVLWSATFTNVNQTSPTGTFQSNSGTSTTPSLTLGSASGDVVVDVMAAEGSAGNFNQDASQTAICTGNTGTGSGNARGGGSTKPGASSVTMSWTLTASKKWEIGAVSLRAATPPQADIQTTKTGASTVFAASNLTYTVTVTNLGPATATNVMVRDTLPTNTVFVSASAGGTNAAGVVGWPLITTFANAATTTLTVTVTAPASGILTNIASSSAGSSDPYPTNNDGSAAAGRVITTVTPLADLLTIKSGPTSVNTSTNFNYSIVVTNLGPSTATSLVVTDTLPASLTFISATGGGTTNATLTNVFWSVASLSSGGATNFGLTVRATADGILTNRALTGSAVTDPVSSNNTSNFITTVISLNLTGTVFEDVNYGGGAGRTKAAASGVARPSVRVELYDASSNYLGNATTDGSGNYSFTVTTNTTYKVRVVNSTVKSSRTGGGGSELGVQTYRVSATNGTANAVTDRVGGEDPSKVDAGNGSTTLGALINSTNAPQSVCTVTVGTNNVTGVDFGFNFDTIVNTNDTGQGSVRQFLTNANTLGNAGLAQVGQTAGKEVSIFMVSDGSAHAGLRAGLANQLAGGVAIITCATRLPIITDANTTLDGTTQTANVGDTNPGQLGVGGTVGVDGLTVSQVNRPEVQIFDGGPNIGWGLELNANSVTVRGISIYGFGNNRAVNFSEGNILVGGSASGVLIEQNVIGTPATSFSDPGATDRTLGDNITIWSNAVNTVVQNNLIGYAAYMGVLNHGAAQGATVEGNEIRGNGIGHPNQDGVSTEGLAGTTTVRGNLIVDGEGPGIDSPGTSGGNTYVNNTINNNGIGNSGTVETPGIRVWASGTTIDRNIINANFGAGVMVTTNTTGAKITKNSIYANGTILNKGSGGPSGQIGIDLLAGSDDPSAGTSPFVSTNDLNDADSGGNGVINYPILTTAVISNGNLVVSGFVRPTQTIEFFIANADPSGFGEGQTYLFTGVEGGGSDLDAGSGTYGPAPINGLSQGTDSANKFTFVVALPGGVSVGTKLTATATDASNNTSEFSGVVTVVGQTDIAVIKSGPATIYAASNITYTVTLTNVSPYSATNVTVSDTLPTNTVFVSASAGGTNLAGVVGWPLITSFASAATSNFTVTVTTPLTGILTNAATAATTSPEFTTSNNTSNHIGTVTARADLLAIKTGPASINAASNFTYSITVTNLGPSTATSLVVTDTLPASVAFVSASAGGTTNASGSVYWSSIASFASGASSNFTVTVRSPESGTLTNSALAGSAITDLVSGNNTSNAVTTVIPHTPVITDLYALRGTPANNIYRIYADGSADSLVYSNYPGGSSATLAMRPSDGMLFYVVYAANGALYRWDPATPAAAPVLVGSIGAAVPASLRLAFAPDGTLYYMPDDNLYVLDQTTGAATLEYTITGTGGGGDMAFAPDGTLYIANNSTLYRFGPPLGNGAATSVGAFSGFSSGTESVVGLAWDRVNTRMMLLTADATSSGYYVVNLSNAVLTRTGNATGGGATGDLGTAPAVSTLADLGVVKTGPASVLPGTNFTYTVAVTNHGPWTATSVAISDTLPASVTFVSASASGTNVAGVVGWPAISRFPSGANTSVTVTVTAPLSGLLTNSATATTSSSDTNAANNTSTLITTVNSITVSGTVFEDVNYGGGVGRSKAASSGVARPNARIELYNATGNFVTNALTDGSGNFSLNLFPNTNYTVRVVNNTVTSSRTGGGANELGVQTYRTDATNGLVAVTDHVGGEVPGKTDPGNGSTTLAALTTSTNAPQSITTVTISTNSITGLDFGFNFNTVVNTNDTAQGSLRQFIGNANALANAGLAQSGRPAGIDNAIWMLSDGTARAGMNTGYTSQFSSGIATIRPASALPTITGAVVIDGATQPGFVSTPIIELTGASAGNVSGLSVTAGGSTVRGLVINLFTQSGIVMSGSGGNTIQGNYLGTDVTGSLMRSNNQQGVYINGVSGNLIGGAGTTNRNVISGNRLRGILLSGAGANNNTIQNNYIGVTAAGNAALLNAIGVYFNDAPNNTLGGTGAGQGNVVSGNTQIGVYLVGSGASGNSVQGNTIGLDATAAAAIPNGAQGIDIIVGAANNTIGGTAAGAGNIISANGSRGIRVSSTGGTGNLFQRNSIYGNTSLGIELGLNDGVTGNNGALDGVPNSGMDYPIFTRSELSGTTLTVAGYVGSASNQATFASASVEIFKADNAPADQSGEIVLGDGKSVAHGEGRTYLGTLTTDASGNFSTNLTVAGLSVGDDVTATASLAVNGTSEFGPNAAVLGQADILTIKTGPVSVNATSNFNYSITVTNLGPAAATNLMVSDTLPASVSFVSASAGGTNVAGVVGWPLITSFAAATATNYTVTVTAPAAGILTNSATAAIGNTDPVSANNTSNFITTVTGLADLLTIKTGPASVNATSNFTYSITVTNLGPSTATSLVVTDTLPASVTFISATSGGTTNSSLTNVYWSVSSLASGASSNLGVTVRAPASGILTNIALAGSAITDPVSSNNSSNFITSVTGLADLLTIKTGPASVNATNNLSYSIVITNLGPSAATSLVVTDTLPASVTFLSATGGGTTNASGAVYWSPIASFASGATTNFTVNVRAPASGILTNVALAGSAISDPVSSNNTSNFVTSVASQADLATIKTGPTNIGAGTNFSYTITVTNLGPSTATSLVVTDTLPASVTFVSASAGGTTNATGAVYWSPIASFAGGATSNFTVTVTSPASGILTNAAVAGSAITDPVSSNNTSNFITSVSQINISGTVFEDVNYGGGAGRTKAASSGAGRPNARVELYNAAGNFVTNALTDGSGLYTFAAVLPTNYTVRVVNNTVTSSRTGGGAGELGVQTYRTDATNGTVSTVTDRVGGEDPVKSDPGNGNTTLAALTTSTNAPQSITSVKVIGADVTGVDFGFNFDTIVNTNDTAQGSLRQFVSNANALGGEGSLAQSGNRKDASNANQALPAGKETSIFMISDGAAHAGLRAGLANQLTANVAVIRLTGNPHPAITGANTTIDGTTQTANVGDSNGGQLGAGGSVGVDAASLSQVYAPEVEIIPGATTPAIGLEFNANNTTLRGVSIYGFGTADFNSGHQTILVNGSNLLIENNVVGSKATSFTNPRPTAAGRGNLITVRGGGGTIQNNLIGFASAAGVGVESGATAAWTVWNNEFRGNGVDCNFCEHIVSFTTLALNVGTNLFADSRGSGLDVYTSNPANQFVNNTITHNGLANGGETAGFIIHGSGATIQKNIINANTGNGVMVATNTTGITISQNSIYGNGTTAGIGIDLLKPSDNQALGTAPYVTTNDVNDADSGGNDLINFPILTRAVVSNAHLVVSGYVRAGQTIEFFIANPNGSGFGEGQTYLFTGVEGSGADQDTGSGSYGPGLINGLSQGSDNANKFQFTVPLPGGVSVGTPLTTTATDGSGNTSEFSGIVNAEGLSDILTIKTGPVAINAASNFTYSVTVTNLGPAAATNLMVSDTLPASVTFVSASAGGTNVAGVVGWPLITSFANGAGTNYSVTVTAPATGILTNSATAAIGNTDPISANNTSNFITSVSGLADLLTIKTGPASVNATSNFTYSITVTNIGPSTATSLVVTDTLPANVTFISATSGGTTNSTLTNVFWSVASLASGASSNLGVTVRAPASGILTNIALAGSAITDPVSSNNTSNFITSVTGLADLLTIKTGPASVNATSNFNYSITVTNIGPSTATSLVVTDTLPASVTFISATSGGTTNSSLTNVFWTVSSLASGGFTNLGVTVKAPATGILTNIALAGSAITDPVSANNTSNFITSVSELADIITCKKGPAAVFAGTNFTYTVTVTNAGPSTASSVSVIDTLPAEVSFVSASAGGTNDNGVVGWPAITSFAKNATTNLIVTVTAPASGILTNFASSTAATTDPNAANNNGSAVNARVITDVSAVPEADVITTKTGPALVLPGTNFVYTITVTNAGPSAANNVAVADTLPAAVSFVSASDGGTNLAGVVGWPLIASFADGTVTNFTVTVTAPATGLLTNTVASTADTDDPDAANNDGTASEAQVVTEVRAEADIVTTKAGPAAVFAGTNFTYTVTVTNAGPLIASTVSVTDTLPATVTFLSASAGGTNLAGVVGWPVIGSLTNGTAVSFTVTVKAPDSGVLTNTAASTATTFDPDATNNDGSAPAAQVVTIVNGFDVTGFAYGDVNKNGFKDTDEAGTGLTLYAKLFPASTPSGPATHVATVDTLTGVYTLTNVLPGTYIIIIDNNNTPADVTPTLPAGWVGTEVPDQTRTGIVVAYTTVPNQNFGLVSGSTLTGKVFADTGAGGGTANDGIANGTETGIAGVTVRLTDNPGTTVYDTAVTDGAGNYTLYLPDVTATLKVTQTNLVGYVSTGASIGTTGGSYDRGTDTITFSHTAGASHSGVDFGDVMVNTFTADGLQSAMPGQVVFYAHTFTAGAGGTVTFSAVGAPNPAMSGWSQVIYRDSNCNGLIDTGEPVVTGGIAITTGQAVCIIVKETVPVGAPFGAQDKITVSADFTFENNPLLTSTLTRTDLTTVGALTTAGLTLHKEVDKTTAAPGETIVYVITYANTSAGDLSNIVIYDATPAYTTFTSAGTGPLPANLSSVLIAAPGVGAAGGVRWEFSGTLAPSSSGTVTYSVTVE